MSDFVYRFSIRKTPCGATATMTTPSGRVQVKRFRNGYACAEISANKWIKEQTEVLRECEAIDGKKAAKVVID